MIVGLAATAVVAVKVVVVVIVVAAAIVAVTAKVKMLIRMVNDTVVSVFDIHWLICMYIC